MSGGSTNVFLAIFWDIKDEASGFKGGIVWNRDYISMFSDVRVAFALLFIENEGLTRRMAVLFERVRYCV
jgi:hypothetical protein